MVARFISDPKNQANSPTGYKGYEFTLNWNIGNITGAYIQSRDISHFLSFNGTKATLIRIDFNNGGLSFQRPLPSIISSLESTVFTSSATFYSLGR
jgi:hypothetical protein